MATRGISQRKSRGISAALASAVLEWLLIFMLFINAIFSYLITKFSSHWELQVPCLLCSRLDHILGNSTLKYYRDLICRNHKLEISSLGFCHEHNKLVDVHGLCESCLFSFATINKSNAETYRLLVGKLGEKPLPDESSLDLLVDEFGRDPSSNSHIPIRPCSCCNKPWVPGACGQRVMRFKSYGSEAADRDVVLSEIIGDCQDILEKGKPSVPVKSTSQGTRGLASLSHVGYSKLNIDSDTESQVLSSDDDHDRDDDDENPLLCEADLKDDVFAVGYVDPEPRIITVPDDQSSEKLISPVSETEPSILISQVQSDAIANSDVASARMAVSIGHGSEEYDWQQADLRVDLSAVPELISLDKVTPPPITIDTPVDATIETKVVSLDEAPSSPDEREITSEALEECKVVSEDEVPPLSDTKECHAQASEEIMLISVDDVDLRGTYVETSEVHKHNSVVDSSSSGQDTPVRGLKDNSAGRPEEVYRNSAWDCDEISKNENWPATCETASEATPVSCDNGLQTPSLLDLSDAYKLAVGTRGRALSGVLVEQWTGKDSSRISEDLKLLLSQLSATREQSVNEMSPRVPISPKIAMSPKLSLNSDEVRVSDASSTIGLQILQKRISLERNESGLSLDGSTVGEIEGESVVDRLKRQVEHDKKLLSALYKELEEERNASTIAANQAMAMITRLQEEKATLHMEALQCLRMMEEQAEYDMEALQKTNDILAEKEKEVQDLEAELEFYRNKFPNESTFLEIEEQVTDMKSKDTRVYHTEASSVDDGTNGEGNCTADKPNISEKVEGTNVSVGDEMYSLSELEKERKHT